MNPQMTIAGTAPTTRFQMDSRGTQPYMHMCPFSPDSLPSRLPHNMEQSSLCYAIVGLFSIVLEVLATVIREEKERKGIQTGKEAGANATSSSNHTPIKAEESKELDDGSPL